jgi:hypothetical protein
VNKLTAIVATGGADCGAQLLTAWLNSEFGTETLGQLLASAEQLPGAAGKLQVAHRSVRAFLIARPALIVCALTPPTGPSLFRFTDGTSASGRRRAQAKVVEPS